MPDRHRYRYIRSQYGGMILIIRVVAAALANRIGDEERVPTTGRSFLFLAKFKR